MNIAHVLSIYEKSDLLKPVGNNQPKAKTKPKYAIKITDNTKANVINALKEKRGLRSDEVAKVIGFGIDYTKRILTLMYTDKLVNRTVASEKSRLGAFLYYDIDDKLPMPDKNKDEADMIFNCIKKNKLIRNPDLEKAVHLSAHRVKSGLRYLCQHKKITKVHAGKSGNHDIYAYKVNV